MSRRKKQRSGKVVKELVEDEEREEGSHTAGEQDQHQRPPN